MNPYLIPALTLSPRVFERIVPMIDPVMLDQPTHPDRFSPREVIAHLADWEPILRGRIQQTVENPGSEIVVQDEGQMAVDHDYAHSDLGEQLRLWAERREETVEFLKGLGPDDWGKEARHPERGVQSVSDQANMLIGHDMYHVEQMIAAVGY